MLIWQNYQEIMSTIGNCFDKDGNIFFSRAISAILLISNTASSKDADNDDNDIFNKAALSEKGINSEKKYQYEDAKSSVPSESTIDINSARRREDGIKPLKSNIAIAVESKASDSNVKPRKVPPKVSETAMMQSLIQQFESMMESIKNDKNDESVKSSETSPDKLKNESELIRDSTQSVSQNKILYEEKLQGKTDNMFAGKKIDLRISKADSMAALMTENRTNRIQR
jgi:uncharacterized membrane protein YfhO